MKTTFLSSMTMKSKIILLLIVIGILVLTFAFNGAIVGLFFAGSPIILLIIVVNDEGKSELGALLMFAIYMTLQALYMQVYFYLYIIENFSVNVTDVLQSVILVLLAFLFIYYIPTKFLQMKKFVRRLLYVFYIVLCYLYSFLIMWILAWAGYF